MRIAIASRLVLIVCLVTSGSLLLRAAERPLEIPHLSVELPHDETVTWGRLDNGLIYAVMPNSEPEGKFSLRLYVRVGSMQEESDERGLAHYLEHMGFNGSRHYPVANQVIEELQKIGVAFGRDSNAHTSFDETVYKLDMPDNKSATLEQGLRVFSDWAAYLHNRDEEVIAERGIILSEMRDREGPGMRIWRSIYQKMFPGLTLGHRFPIGTKETISDMQPEQLRAFYQKWYRPDRMVLTVVGDVDPDKTVTAIRQHFAEIPAASDAIVHPDYGTFEPASEISFSAQHEEEYDQTFLYYAVTRPHTDMKDGIARRKIALHRQLVSGIMNRRLQDYVEDNPDGAILSGGLRVYHRYGMDIAAISVQPRPGEILAATVVLEQELRRMRSFGPSEQELEVAAANIKAELEQAVSSKSRRTNRSLATRLYTSVKRGLVFQTPEQEQALMLELLDAVELKDIQAAIDLAFDSGHQFLGLFGRETLGDDTAEQLKRTFIASSNVELQAPAAVESADWAYDDRPQAADGSTLITADERVAHGIRQLRFSNQVRAAVLPRDAKKNQILFSMRISLLERDPAIGVREAFRAFMSGGLGQHTAKELRQVQAGTRARVSVSADSDALVISGSCPPEELELMLQMARAWLTDPGWRASGFDRLRTSWLESLKAEGTDLEATLSRRWAMLTSGGQPRLRTASIAEVQALEWQDVRDWAEPALQQGAVELAVVGDVDEEQCVALLRDYFGTLPERQALQVIEDLTAAGALEPIAPLPHGEFRFSVDATVKRALLRLMWPTDDNADVQRTRRLNQLSQIVSDRLRKEIREKLGDAYSPYAVNRSSGDFDAHGYFYLNVGVAPERADEVLPIMRQVVADLLREGINDDQFQRIMEPTIKRLPAWRDSNNYWLQSVVARCLSQPQRLAWAASMIDDYQSMTKEELMQLAQKYLSGKALAVIAISRGVTANDDPTTSTSPDPEQSVE